MVIAGRDPGQPPVALRAYLNPHVDLGLTDETAQAPHGSVSAATYP